MRLRRLRIFSMFALLAAVTAAGSSRVRSDLDSYANDRLLRDLGDEMNDVLESLDDPDDEIPLDELPDAILEALDDAGDTGYELDLSLEDLEDEMWEAGTDLETVIREAIDASGVEFALRTPQTKHPRTVRRLQAVSSGMVRTIRAVSAPPRTPQQRSQSRAPVRRPPRSGAALSLDG